MSDDHAELTATVNSLTKRFERLNEQQHILSEMFVDSRLDNRRLHVELDHYRNEAELRVTERDRWRYAAEKLRHAIGYDEFGDYSAETQDAIDDYAAAQEQRDPDGLAALKRPADPSLDDEPF